MQTGIEGKLEDAGEVMELGDYIKELKDPYEDKLKENASWLSWIWYKLNKKPARSRLCNKDVKVKGTLVDFKFGKEFLVSDTLYVYVCDQKGEVTEFRRPFSSSNIENPSWNYYTTALHDLKEKEITFIADSFPKGGIFPGFYYFILGVFKENKLIRF
ncbi:hypothetical protein KY342_01155 [Candidatus Woesearchaeota archaeon]|nr:hypothetical protein [Candidatus Woesearchaeota archaeon]